jgi:prepilin-type N-terminal cleavage/methylation domain-containing protein
MNNHTLPPLRIHPKKTQCTAFTLVEVLAVVAVLGLLATVVILNFGSTRSSAAHTKLLSDVNVLNHAVKLYVAEGGRLDDVSTHQQVIERLKTKSTAEVARRHVGPVTGRLIDPRLAAKDLTASEVATKSPRAVWNASLQKFVVTTEGAGIGSFSFDDTKAGVAATTEARQRSSMLFNRTDGWVWEWGTHPGASPLSPNEYDLAAGGGTPPPPGSPPPTTVPPPTTPPGGFQPPAVPLPPPTILPDGGAFSVANFPSAIMISANGAGPGSMLQYRVDSEGWKAYGSAFSVVPGTRVFARNISLDPARWIDSPEDTEIYLRIVALFTGNVIPSWANMGGGGNLVQLIDNARVDDVRASYGTATVDGAPPNRLSFLRAGFISVPPDTDFKLGQLVYYNGTVRNGTEASSVDLKLNIQLLTPTTQSGTASANMSLWSSDNNGNERESADYVQLDNPQTNFVVQVDGMTYTLRLRFANVKAEEGWTDGTKLYVYEDALGHADLIARFVSGY